MIYEKATAEVILFDNSDVIRTSGCDKGNSNGMCNNATGDINCKHKGVNGVNAARSTRAARAGL